MGFSDARARRSSDWRTSEAEVRARRKAAGIVPVYKRVDTCSAEFESFTPYLYSTYERECEAAPTERKKVMILGSGPNRIGQGIEFDYCCCHAAFAFKEEGYETIMVNCNPETVSTDYDTSDRLYFEPLTFEDVMNVRRAGEARGRRDPVRRADAAAARGAAARAGVKILGTSPDAIDLAEDRKRFSALLDELDIPQPESGTATSLEEAKVVAERIGYPVLVRPSYVLGGRAMAIVYDDGPPRGVRARGREGLARAPDPDRPLPRGRLRGGRGRARRRRARGDRRHPAAHRGGRASTAATRRWCCRPTRSRRSTSRRSAATRGALGLALGVRGLMNVQYAIKDDVVYVLEVNPRASRTTPFVSKATGVPLAKVAARIMAGRSLAEQGLTEDLTVDRIFVKESVFPFLKFPGADILLGPEMKSTGEVMGISNDFGIAFAKAAAGRRLSHPDERAPSSSASTTSTSRGVLPHARALHEMGFRDRRHARHRRVPERARRQGRDRVQGARGPPERAST